MAHDQKSEKDIIQSLDGLYAKRFITIHFLRVPPDGADF